MHYIEKYEVLNELAIASRSLKFALHQQANYTRQMQQALEQGAYQTPYTPHEDLQGLARTRNTLLLLAARLQINGTDIERAAKGEPPAYPPRGL